MHIIFQILAMIRCTPLPPTSISGSSFSMLTLTTCIASAHQLAGPISASGLPRSLRKTRLGGYTAVPLPRRATNLIRTGSCVWLTINFFTR
ncbi:hypothetical protein BDR04DRAFT_1111554 [Suillus decipiens]|nr:hypothetical protein BDR04DRAFT_1111554 [Suillus decipiens]